jgi:hypothetical protein
MKPAAQDRAGATIGACCAPYYLPPSDRTNADKRRAVSVLLADPDAVAAGIVRVPTTLEQLRRAWAARHLLARGGR